MLLLRVHSTLLLVAFAICALPPHAQAQRDADARRRIAERYVLPIRREFQVDGVTRQALVFAPKTALSTPTPVLFGFHGHGGTMQKSVEMFGFPRAWPDAIIVYPQGLPTPTPGDPQGRRPGWLVTPVEQNRDLRFFDMMVQEVSRTYKVDATRVFAAGNSNGGFFCYTLWAARPNVVAAVGPGAATLGRLEQGLQPKPVFCTSGQKDRTVPFAQQTATIETLKRLNGCGEGVNGKAQFVTIYPSRTRTPVVTYIHPGGHGFPKEATEPLVAFFKRTSAEP